VDASNYKVRHGLRYVSKVLPVIAGVRHDECHEILVARIAACENEAVWPGLFDILFERGLSGVQFVIFNRHQVIQNAAMIAFVKTS